MEEKEYIRGYDRAIFLKTCEQRELSEDTQLVMSDIIRDVRLRFGDEKADKKAKELTEIINSCQTEDEILDAIGKRKHLGHDRAILLDTTMKRGLSENTQLEIAKIIKETRLKFGSEASDEKAKELTEIINNCDTEEEILKEINRGQSIEEKLETGKDVLDYDNVRIRVITDNGPVCMTYKRYNKYLEKQNAKKGKRGK